MSFLKLMFGNYSKRELKRIKPILDSVLALEKKYLDFSDEELANQTNVLKERLSKGETLDDILPDAFAVCREASDRVLGMRHFPVQIIGGIVLHQGRISQMMTGEGKTLVETLPAYLNALTGKGVHVITVNDYLAKRDSELMGKLYRFLGLSVGLIVSGINNAKRMQAYRADITYGTNNEFGFDYLRDNMVTDKRSKVQREHNFAIVDEVDSILIDEARTPLIISGEGDKSTELYSIADEFVKTLDMLKVAEVDAKEDNEELFENHDYVVDEKAKTATLTKTGVEKAEQYFHIDNLTDPEHLTLQHHINQALKAHGVMQRDIDYVVRDGEVLIVDEFTGRIMYGRRYNDGLHQAIEAKEKVKIEKESKTLASITFQNYFRLYTKLSGMTGTASTEEEEFREIYKLDIVEVPTNRPIARIDMPDVVYATQKAKFKAIVDEIIEHHKKGQPVLVGTVSIEKSELLSVMLDVQNIPHAVLNAKYHEKEAEIIAQAGKKGAITIATNMAGRGTDIALGGNSDFMAKAEMRRLGYGDELLAEADGFSETDDEKILEAREKYKELKTKYKNELKDDAEEVRKLGGLYVIGTERHETRRIDNQLRGRSGRQGDPGKSRFFLSLEDDLMRLFGGERIQRVMSMLNLEEDTPLEAKMLTKSIESAQRKIEGHHYAIRKNVLQYDDVLNRQREIIYAQRNQVLDGENLREQILNMINDTAEVVVKRYIVPEADPSTWNIEGLKGYYMDWVLRDDDAEFNSENPVNMSYKEIVEFIRNRCREIYEKHEEILGNEMARALESSILLKNVDEQWMDHIDAMEELKKGIGLRSYGQKDPVVEYRVEGFEMFDSMVLAIRENTVKTILSFKFGSKNIMSNLFAFPEM